jgi:hypothetical protein
MRQQTRDRQRAGEANRRSNQREAERLTQHEADHISAAGTERHADTHLVRALTYHVRHHAIEADGGEQESQQREYPEQRRIHARLRE